ncbi:MAG: hypothetical protein KF767_12930 [Bdellovibrionaceae bacterium]|nr:hypothetical protein [Pseudobdellovibrionaceae bacterium]
MVLGFNKNAALLLGSLLFLAACDKADEKANLVPGGESQATFLVDKASGEAELINPDTKDVWQTPISASFSFMACLKDRANGETLRGQRFGIEKQEDGTQLPVEEASDVNGCIKWVEEIPFNYFAKRSARLPITRYVLGQGIHAGRAEVKLAINPWALGSGARDKGDSVVFLRDQILPKNQMAPMGQMRATLSGESHGNADLWIPEVSINSLRRKDFADGQAIDLSFEVKPRVRVQNMNGEIDYFDLKAGEFDIVAHLIATDTGANQNERVLLTPQELQGSAKLIDGSLVVQTRTSLERRVSSGNLELALKLIPKSIGSLRSLNAFEGVYELGAAHELSRSPKGMLTQACRKGEITCRMSQTLEATSNFDKLRAQGYGLKNEPYIFSNLKLRFVSVEPGETATQRDVAYAASTCIKDRWTGQDMADQPFQIEYLDEKGAPIAAKTQTRMTNEEGCLSWESTIFHKYYQPERLIWHDLRITRPGGYQKSLRFALNPWDDKFTFGWDEREFSKDFTQKLQTRKKIPSRFFLADFGYHAIRFLYNIDRFMELEVKKTVLMELNPRVLRYSGIVNARRQIEDLRDGIYLMKVAIEKNYLDPADKGRHIKNKRENIPSAVIEELGGEVARKEYITSQTHLVRVVDGRIIHPVELTMRDLRLMRVRSNFLIQLETVDERLLQGHQVLREQYKKDLAILAERRGAMKDLPVDQREAELRKEAEDRKAKLESAFFLLKERLASEAPSLDNMNLALEESVMAPLKAALDTNDFTDVKLPSNEDFDVNNFIEKDSGLERRTFVGPVIYLSNGYSDSVRATDNLDEARCQEPYSEDLAQKGLASNAAIAKEAYKWEEMALFTSKEKDIASSRQNNAYRFSKYYGSLKHLCYKQVDDLIAREKQMEAFYHENMPVLSSIYNYVSLYNLEFLSFGLEQPKKLDESCQGSVESCMRTTQERILQPANALKYVNQEFAARQRAHSRNANDQIAKLPKSFTMNDLEPLLFSKIGSTTSNVATCALLSGRVAERLNSVKDDEKYSSWFNSVWGTLWHSESELAAIVFRHCMLDNNAGYGNLVVEDKLRVNETGKYTFLGGLQINLNVGESFSLGRSNSWGYSFKPTDVLDGPMIVGGAAIGAMIGGPAGAVVGAGVGFVGSKVSDILKPISISYGGGMSSSDGTSVSQSTYLVAQIARFSLELTNYEQCRVARFDPEWALKITTDNLGLNSRLAELVARGVFICSGRQNQAPRNVEESYFYFTQHFTEGDMLDQADLYNHPWLLGLRGVREFSTFVNYTNSQEVLNLANFTKGIFTPEKRRIAWPLAHMENTYRKMLPTYPGLYTIVDNGEKTSNYPLAERLTTTDNDLNSEVRCKMNAQGVCAEKLQTK